MWTQFLAEPYRQTFVVDTPTGMAGFIHFRVPPEETEPVELVGLYVAPEWIGQGIGSTLYIQFGRSLGGREAELEVWQGNERAQRFYQARGWVPTGRLRAGPDEQPFVTWRLSPDPSGSRPWCETDGFRTTADDAVTPVGRAASPS